jgi:hypothetical protein
VSASGLQGVEEGIDHGTVRGYRQHKRRHVKVCGRCQKAFDEHNADTPKEKDTRSLMSSYPLSPGQRTAAARTIARAAMDDDDLQLLLEATGLSAADLDSP